MKQPQSLENNVQDILIDSALQEPDRCTQEREGVNAGFRLPLSKLIGYLQIATCRIEYLPQPWQTMPAKSHPHPNSTE